MAVQHIVDIGANLLDDMFKGIYSNGRRCHPPDLPQVLQRARDSRIGSIIITASSVQDVPCCMDLMDAHKDSSLCLYTTCGVHPTQASETLKHSPDYYEQLLRWSHSPRVVAIGECGLDYARENFSSSVDQQTVFSRHFGLAAATGKPMFLHLRDAFSDFYRIVSDHRMDFGTAVVHSFTGTVEQARMLLDLDLYIGINGCSVRTTDGIEVVRQVPLERILVESDAPWCELRPSHASASHWNINGAIRRDRDRWSPDLPVKGRNEPAACLSICQIIASVKGIDVEQVCQTVYNTTTQVFKI